MPTDIMASAAEVDMRKGFSGQAGVEVAKGVIKAEMAKRRLSYKGLSDVLYGDFGIDMDERNLRNKVSRGSFTAGWFFELMMMLGVKTLDLQHLYKSTDELLAEPGDVT